MAPPKPTAKLDLGDGQTRVMAFDMAAAWEFEDATGMSIDELDAGDDGTVNLSAKALCSLVAAMLREDDPAITAEHVGRHLHMGNMSEVTGKVAEVVGASQPDDEGDEGAGGDSGPS